MARTNCWEALRCGREPGGARVSEMGVCPAAVDASWDGFNGGKNAGRACWNVAGTFCGGKRQGTFAEKQVTCMACDFFVRVKTEEGAAFRLRKVAV